MYELAETSQQEIQVAKIEVEKAGKKVEFARYENLPEFKVGLFYAGIGSPDVSMPPPNAGDDAIGIQAGISLPIWFGKNKGRTARAGIVVNNAILLIQFIKGHRQQGLSGDPYLVVHHHSRAFASAGGDKHPGRIYQAVGDIGGFRPAKFHCVGIGDNSRRICLVRRLGMDR